MRKSITDSKPWERQPGEPIRAFRYFTLYRDMQMRSLAKLARAMGRRNPSLFEKYSKQWQWPARCEAWDEELDSILRSKTVDELCNMRERHVNLALGMQTAVVKELKALVRRVEAAEEKARQDAIARGQDPDRAVRKPVLKVNEMIRLSEHGVSLERLSRGEPTAHTRTESEVDLSMLSIEEIKTLKKLHSKTNKK